MTDGERSFLSLAPVRDDPAAEDFNHRMEALAQRFPGGAARFGTVRHLVGGTLLFSTADEGDAWPALARRLAEVPSLHQLADAKLIRVDEGRIVRALTASS